MFLTKNLNFGVNQCISGHMKILFFVSMLHFGRIQVSYLKLNFRVNQCISGHVISQNMKIIIKFALSQPFLKIETSALDQKFIELSAVHFTILGVINYISSHMTIGINHFLIEKCQFLRNGS